MASYVGRFVHISRKLAFGRSGSVSVLFVMLMLFLGLIVFLTGDLAIYASGLAKAEDAADAAALSAVQEAFPLFSTGIDPREAAVRIARLNDCSVENLRISHSLDRAEVTVSYRPKYILLGRLNVGLKIRAKGAAEVDYQSVLKSGLIAALMGPGAAAAPDFLFATLAKDGKTGALSSQVVILALQQIGKPYVWGASGPKAFDCSGLVYFVYRHAGLSMPRVTYQQVKCGREVPLSELCPGDLIFFRGNSHVGIYIGGGFFVHAPHNGDVVRIAPISGRRVSACRKMF